MMRLFFRRINPGLVPTIGLLSLLTATWRNIARRICICQRWPGPEQGHVMHAVVVAILVGGF